jgi:hypothetical protein
LITIFNQYGAPYKPSTQGRVERFNQTIEKELGKYLTEKKIRRWMEALPMVTRSYNLTVHQTTKTTPFKALHGWQPLALAYITDLIE